MENYTRIYLEGFGSLELYDNVPVSLNYSVAEIQDISKKNSSFSKTINIPGTKNNNELLGQLFDISIADSNFDINRKVPCKIYGADIILMKGYFRLMGINKVSPTSAGGEELIEYEALVFDQTTDFYDKLSDTLLSDLDFSQYNHTYGYSSVIGSSAHTSDDVYCYPMLYNNNTTAYYTNDFQPAIYLKSYIDMAFQTVQYSYESQFFESDYFKSLIIPFNGEKVENTQAVIDGRKFQVGMTGASDFVSYTYAQSATTSFFSGITMPYNSDNNQNVPYFDSGNTYNVSTNKFVSDANQSFDLRFKIKAQTFATNPLSQSIKLYDGFGNAVLSQAKISCRASLYKNGVSILNSPVILNQFIGNTITSGSSSSTATTTLDYTFANIQAGVGDQFEVRLKPGIVMPLNSTWRLGPGYGSTTQYYPTFTIKLDVTSSGQTSGNNFLLNAPHLGELMDGDTVELNNFIPKQQKIKDVFSSVLKMFNLYVEQDGDYENKLLIKTREQYYSGNTYSNWTDKIAIDRDVNIKFIPELQNKDLILTYKQDSDVLNKSYFDQTKEVYGQKKYIFDNDFLQGQKKVELIFSPTPLVKNGFNLTVPGILSQSPKNNIRILYKPNSWVSQSNTSWNYKYVTTGGTVATSTFTSYPYAGHFDSPQFPTEDINFGQTQYLYYSDYGKITDNNLSNKYYFNQVDQMLEGKMLTAYFDLNYVDILNLRFSDKVFIKDTYYIINKVMDFNPINGDLTKVELLKVDDGLKFRTRNKKPVRPILIDGTFLNTGSTVGVGNPTKPTVKGELLSKFDPFTIRPGSIVLGNNTGNIVNSKNAIVSGEGNFVEESTKAFIIGDSNTADGGSKTMIIGTGNTVSSESSNMVVGNDNVIPIEVDSVFIIGNNITADTSNTLYTDNIEISPGSTLNGYTIAQLASGGTGGGDSYWTSGSTGTDSIRANNSSGVDATGNYAVAEGSNTLASGANSHAEGSETIASGNSSHAEGYQTEANGQFAHAEGYITEANGDWSHAEGAFTIASGLYSHAEGGNTTASSAYTHSEGHYTQATGYAAHAGGWLSIASGDFSFAHGKKTLASGDTSFAIGSGNTAGGSYSFAGGQSSYVKGVNSLAYGLYNESDGDYQFIFGVQNTGTTAASNAYVFGSVNIATGADSIAFGTSNSVTAASAKAFGANLIVSGTHGVAFGKDNTVSGNLSTATGEDNIITGGYSFVTGQGNIVTGDYAAAFGNNSKAANTNTFVLGDSITGTSADTTYVDNLNVRGTSNLNGPLNVSGLTSFAIIGGDANGYNYSIDGGDANFPVFSASSGYYPYILTGGTTFTFTGQTTVVSIASLTAPTSVVLPTYPNHHFYIVKDKTGNAGTYPITVSSVGNTINGETDYTINIGSKPSLTFLWDGSEFITI